MQFEYLIELLVKVFPFRGLLRARVASLKSVRLGGLELCHLVAKCPSMLAADEIDPFILFVGDNLDGKVDPT